MTIIPISVTQVDWNLFIKSCEKILGYSPSRTLDAKKLTLLSPDAYIHALSSFETQENGVLNLKHVHVSFLMIIPDHLYTELLENFYQDINFIRSRESRSKVETVLIATGNLDAWKAVCLHLNTSFECRELSYKLYELLRRFNIFDEYRVAENVDGSRFLQKR